MRKSLVRVICSVLLATLPRTDAVAGHHHTRKASLKPVSITDQHRNAKDEAPGGSDVSGTCGLFPGPCQ